MDGDASRYRSRCWTHWVATPCVLLDSVTVWTRSCTPVGIGTGSNKRRGGGGGGEGGEREGGGVGVGGGALVGGKGGGGRESK